MPDFKMGVTAAIEHAVGRALPELADSSCDLLQSGLVSSLDLVNIAITLEERFNVTISDSTVTPENFASVDTLATLIASLQNSSTSTSAPSAQTLSKTQLSIVSAFRRPFVVAIAFVVTVVALDLMVGIAAQSRLVRDLIPEYVENDKRLYPAGIAHGHGDFRYAVSTSHAVKSTRGEGVRIAVFGDSGTIGSYVSAEASIPGQMKKLLQPSVAGVETFNMAYWQQSFIKDSMIFEAFIDHSTGKVPFDVAVLTVGDAYFNQQHAEGIIQTIDYFGLNVNLFRDFVERLGKQDDPYYLKMLLLIEQAGRQKHYPLERTIKRQSNFYHYAPMLNYIWNEFFKRIYRGTGRQLEWARTVPAAPMYEDVPGTPPKDISYDSGVSHTAYSPGLRTLLEDMIRYLQARGVKVVLYLKPSKPNEWRDVPVKREGYIFAIDIAREIEASLGVTVVDTQLAISGKQFSDSFAHYTVSGNEVIASKLTDGVLKALDK